MYDGRMTFICDVTVTTWRWRRNMGVTAMLNNADMNVYAKRTGMAYVAAPRMASSRRKAKHQ